MELEKKRPLAKALGSLLLNDGGPCAVHRAPGSPHCGSPDTAVSVSSGVTQRNLHHGTGLVQPCSGCAVACVNDIIAAIHADGTTTVNCVSTTISVNYAAKPSAPPTSTAAAPPTAGPAPSVLQAMPAGTRPYEQL
ncbi:hypothetical protein TREES_T100017634 [Tupaia chinensis]|uniref:Uncharacterized protein n=1 Tax=Tupaia chinensis TaxID=246437 RepID=L9L3Y1_TUPCH|nr:hypothetical protein TREES_T100017634 [Tupaia chinensis]